MRRRSITSRAWLGLAGAARAPRQVTFGRAAGALDQRSFLRTRAARRHAVEEIVGLAAWPVPSPGVSGKGTVPPWSESGLRTSSPFRIRTPVVLTPALVFAEPGIEDRIEAVDLLLRARQA